MKSSFVGGLFLLLILLAGVYILQAPLSQSKPLPASSTIFHLQANQASPTLTRTKTPAKTPTRRPPPATPTITPTSISSATPTITPTPTSSPTPTATLPPAIWQITLGNCCTSLFWSNDSTEVRFVDQPVADQALGIWAVKVTQFGAAPYLVTTRLGNYSPDEKLVAYPNRDKGIAIVERLEDGQQWEINTGTNSLFFTPNNQEVLWMQSTSNTPWESGENIIWLANVDGSNVRQVASLPQGEPMQWLADDVLLVVSQNSAVPARMLLSTLSLQDGAQTPLLEISRMQDFILSPDRQRLAYSSFNPNVEENGVWLVDLQNSHQTPQKLPFFGTYRWRDNQHLIFVPLEPTATQHTFYEFDTLSGQARLLFSSHTNLLIANNDWQISPDGSKIALVAAAGTELDGIWILEIRD